MIGVTATVSLTAIIATEISPQFVTHQAQIYLLEPKILYLKVTPGFNDLLGQSKALKKKLAKFSFDILVKIFIHTCYKLHVINRPGVAGAVL